MSSIKKNFIYQSAYQILIIVLPFITSPYVSRVLGPEKTGVFSYSYSVANYFVLFAMLGINNYGNRMIAAVRGDRERLNRTFSSIFSLHFLLSLLVVVAYFAYILLFPIQYKTFAIIQSLYIIAALFDINWFFFGIEEFRLTFTRNTLVKILTVVAIFTFVHTQDDLWKYITIMAAGSLISQSMVWLVIRKYVTFVKPTFAELKSHIVPLLVLFVPVIAVSIYRVMDKILLFHFSTEAQVGFFEYSERIINLPLGIITAFGTVMLPRMSNITARGDTQQGRKYIASSMLFVMFMAYALSFGLAAVSKDFAPVFFGSAYEPSGIIIACMAVTIPFISFANVIRTQYLIPSCKDKVYILSVGLGALVNIVINLILIPRLHALGAAIGTIFAEVTVCIVQSIAVREDLPVFSYIKNSFYFLASGAIMFGAVFIVDMLTERSIPAVVLEVITGAAVYLTLSFIYIRFTKNSVMMDAFKRLFQSKK
ncbi:MAG TPA: flippase [Ruminococcaceae bacterium]|jgi:O-antigen/teichoic acid export membrane protein|nr:flippase [Oscillospiraceae bacterium]HCA29366.1 flippase [Oscillospiraceae bacterium]